MAISAASLIGLVEIRGAEQSIAKLAAVGGTVDSLGAKFGLLAGGAAIVASAALVGVGVVATKMAADFEQAKTLLVTSANELQSNLAMVGAGMLKMSVDVATPVQKLATAMFTVESAGYHGAAGLAVLKAAAEGAKVENADLTKVTQALTTSMHDWHLPASQAVDVMNSFREAAAIGNMKMDDFVGAMKNVGPVASLAKIKLTDVEAALSAMSLEGDKGASAGTHLAQSLLNMIAPSSKAQKVLAEIGLTAQQVSDDMKKSLPDTLAMITDDIGKKFPAGSAAYNHALSDMFGGTRGLKAILELTGQNLKDFTTDAAAIAPTMRANSTAVDGFALVQTNFNFKMDAAKAAIDAVMIAAGTQLLPVLGQVLDKVTPLIVQFGNWVTTSGVLTTAVQGTVVAIQNSVSAVQNVIDFYKRWEPEIQTTAAALAFFFTPAIIASGVEALISAGKITYNFVASLIAAGLNGWAAAAKIAVFTASMIASGVQATVSGAIIVAKFVWSLIQTGVQAAIAGGILSYNFVTGLLAASAESGIAAGIMSGTLIPALTGIGVASWAAIGPLGLLAAAVVGTGAVIKYEFDNFDGNTVSTFNRYRSNITNAGKQTATFSQDVKTSFRDMASSTSASMQDQVSRTQHGFTAMMDSARNSTHTMAQNTKTDFSAMHNWFIADSGSMSATAQKIYSNMVGHIVTDFSNLKQNVIDDMNAVAAYIDNKSALAAAAANANFASIHFPNMAGINTGGSLVHLNFASGTDYAPGGLSMVGEAGPELMYIPRGAQIIPHNQIGGMGGGSGNHSSAPSGQPVQINIHIAGNRVAQVLLPEIVQAIKIATGFRG